MTNPTADLPGWIEPPNPTVSRQHWLTRRDADAAPGYCLGIPDVRVRYHWNGAGFWVASLHESAQRREVSLFGLHSNNGWRLAEKDVAP